MIYSVNKLTLRAKWTKLSADTSDMNLHGRIDRYIGNVLNSKGGSGVFPRWIMELRLCLSQMVECFTASPDGSLRGYS